ncbi:bifunctional peptidase and arginyl-hydroxylase JMJD5-like [Patiria miniata]|uniref:JmjC domain-containing protein n=1 Tax=Patiria miniata TaxID=46514 RepID=A0A914BQ23_PATMI|nr:bifunctional peptidase and arginyl-hydroxylase JMJD5-like [Patiria miniata]
MNIREWTMRSSTGAIPGVFLSFNVVVFVVYLLAFSSTEHAELPPAGHLKPLGWHRVAEPGVDTVDVVPEPGVFFEDYVRKGRPLLMKGAARNMKTFRLWNDEYLRTQFGDLEVEVEEGKKENRSRGLWTMRLDEFVEEYQQGDIYMVASVPTEMADEVELLRCLLCGGFTERLQDAVIWFSSGNTKSVLHFDAVDNINCVMDGQKEFFLVDKNEKNSVFMDHPDGSFSSVDVDHVDMYEYPGLGQVPWYNVTMQPGDCFFIPYRWFHQVRSAAGRSLAINIWFVHLLRFNYNDCMAKGQLPEFEPLGQFQLTSDLEQLRGEIANFIDELEESVLKIQDLPKLADEFEIMDQESLKMFTILDRDKNNQVDLDEVYSCNMKDIETQAPGLVRMYNSGENSENDHDEL